MALTVVRVGNDTPFTEDKPVDLPVGDTVVQTRTAGHVRVPEGNSTTGIWEWFERQLAEAEYSYIISGEGSFTPEGGDPIEFGPGDGLYFDADTLGVWDVRKPIRKAYIIIS